MLKQVLIKKIYLSEIYYYNWISGETFWSTLPTGFSVFACQKESLGKRCLITRDIFYELKSCLQVDQEFFVDCFTLPDHIVLFPRIFTHFKKIKIALKTETVHSKVKFYLIDVAPVKSIRI